MAKERKSSEQGNTPAKKPVESPGVEVVNHQALIINNFKKVEQSILFLTQEKKRICPIDATSIHAEKDHTKYGTLVISFERALEIICNIFFRAVELAEFGELSGNTRVCITKMKHLSLITSEELWITMITSRPGMSSSPIREDRGSLCYKILTLYIDELNELCRRVKQRYTIPA